MENKISVVILNWLRPDNLRYHILPTLIKCPIIDEIIISHGRKDTFMKFYSRKINIINRKDFALNEKFGLSLRFIAGKDCKNKTILILDDDVVPHPACIINMYKVFKKNYPCIVGKYGRIITKNLNYNQQDLPINYRKAPIILTRIAIIDRDLCYYFIKNMSKVEKFVNKLSKPLWNGEDIFMSFLAVGLYNKLGIVTCDDKVFKTKNLKTDNSPHIAISNDKDHILYRSLLIKYLMKTYNNSLQIK